MKEKRGRPKGMLGNKVPRTTLGKIIKKARADKQLVLQAIADRLGCTVQFVSNIEHGRCSAPWDKLDTLAELLGVKSGTLHLANLEARAAFKDCGIDKGLLEVLIVYTQSTESTQKKFLRMGREML